MVKSIQDKQFLEIWNGQHLKRSVSLADLNAHGEVYTQGMYKEVINGGSFTQLKNVKAPMI